MVEEVFTIFVEDEKNGKIYIKKESFTAGSVEAYNAKATFKTFLDSELAHICRFF